MTVADDVLRALRTRPAGLTDAELAAILHKRHQHINQTCRTLARQGLITRDTAFGGIVNKASSETPEQPAPEAYLRVISTGEEWSWEGNVQSRVATHLATTGWSIIRVADTAQRERGVDIIAERASQRLLVEVKGWPSTTYAQGERVGQPKPTQPSTQAGVWFSEGLTTLIRRGAAPGVQLALALPEKPRYRALLSETAWALGRLRITVYLVAADGTVTAWEREG
jgi:Holliday junction resolvase-like predicted endonuclease